MATKNAHFENVIINDERWDWLCQPRHQMNYKKYEIELVSKDSGESYRVIVQPDICPRLVRGEFAKKGFKCLHRVWEFANRTGSVPQDIIELMADCAAFYFGGANSELS